MDALKAGVSLLVFGWCAFVVVRSWLDWKADEGHAPTETNVLTGEELIEVADLGRKICEDLACDDNGIGVPCRTCRLDAVDLMLRYGEIHGAIESDAQPEPSEGGSR